MVQKTFNLAQMQKRGMAESSNSVKWIVGGLLAVVLVAVLSQTIFSYLGTGRDGLGNATANPDAPSWLSPILIVIVAIGLTYAILKAFGMGK